MKGLVVGSAVLLMGAGAQAEQIEVNIYGASAQYKFWTAAAPVFLEDQGCTNIYTATSELEDRDSGIAVCAGTTVEGNAAISGTTDNGMGGDTVVIRYTTNASYDGIRAVMADGDFADECEATVGAYGYRRMIDLAQTDFLAAGGPVVNGLSCEPVTIGASDVAATTFQQTSTGALLGPNGGDVETRSIVYPTDVKNPVDAGLTNMRPIIVPFAFFANANVPVDNLSRMMAVSLFSGKVANWSSFVEGSDAPVVLCLRHAGSGTAATLNAAVMRKDSVVVTSQRVYTHPLVSNGRQPAIYFNKGSSDAVKCIGYDYTGTKQYGAIGYADSDKCGKTLADNAGDSKCDGVRRLTYQGVEGNSTNIKHGQYSFWSAQWMYYDDVNNSDSVLDLIGALKTFAEDDANIAEAGKEDFWAAQGAVPLNKADDFTLPTF